MPDERAPSYELRLRVEPSHIDEQGHVSNVVYVQWMQDAAWAHWKAVATPDLGLLSTTGTRALIARSISGEWGIGSATRSP